MSDWLVVKNWAKHQHYKDRTPPWIKLHYSTLDDYAWCGLPDVSKAHLTGIWLLASREDGRIPNDPVWVAKKIGARSKVGLAALIRAGFLEHDASTAPAACKQNAPLDRDREETEEETETETETDSAMQRKEFELAWSAYPKRPNNPKEKAWKAWLARLKEGVAPETLFDGVTRYAAYCRRERTEPRFVKMAATFFGPDRHWESDYTPSPAPRDTQAPAPALPHARELRARYEQSRRGGLEPIGAVVARIAPSPPGAA